MRQVGPQRCSHSPVFRTKVFASIAYLWRPTGQNLRLSMSDEIATDEDAEADDFEIDTFAQRDPDDPEDIDEGSKKSALARTEEQRRREEQERARSQYDPNDAAPGIGRVAEGETMFSIGGDDEDGPTPVTATMRKHDSFGSAAERRGLIDELEDEEEAEKKKD